MLKSLFINPVTRTFIALIIAMTAVLGAFLTYVTAPESFGKTDIEFDTDTIYYFADDWSLAYDYLDFKFSSGTLVIPAYHQDRVVAVLLIPPEEYPGVLNLSLPQEHRGELPEVIEDNLDQVLIMLDYEDYKNIIRDSGDTILLRAENLAEEDIPKQYINRQLANGYDLLSNYDLYGFTNWLLPTPQTVLLRLWGQQLGTFSYYEDLRIEVTGGEFNISFEHPELETQFYPPEDYQTRAAIYMIFLGMAAAGLIAFLAGGIDNKHSKITGDYQPLWTTAALLGSLLYAWALTAFQLYFQPPLLGSAALWLLPLLMAGTWAHHARLEPEFFGISFQGLGVGSVAALSVATFIALGSTFTLPVGINWDSSFTLLGVAIMFREVLLRGFCQRIISHWLHPMAGLILVSGAWALIVVGTGEMGGLSLLPLVSALGRSLLIGYLFYRSNNLWAAGFLAILLELAPLALVY